MGSSRVRASARHFGQLTARSRRAASSPAAPGRAAPRSSCACSVSLASAHVAARVAQVDGDQLGDRRLVFDDQDTRQAPHFTANDSTASTGGVAHVGALDDVDDGLGQVLGVVADALDGLGHEHQVEARRDGARVFHHVGDQLAQQAVELLVDLVVLLQHPARASCPGGQRRPAPCAAARWPGRPRSAGRTPAARRPRHAGVDQTLHRAGDARRLVAHAFQVGDGLEMAISRRRSRAVGWRRAMMARQVAVDLDLHLVHALFRLQHLAGGLAAEVVSA
jgi:hypothetical protein